MPFATMASMHSVRFANASATDVAGGGWENKRLHMVCGHAANSASVARGVYTPGLSGPAVAGDAVVVARAVVAGAADIGVGRGRSRRGRWRRHRTWPSRMTTWVPKPERLQAGET